MTERLKYFLILLCYKDSRKRMSKFCWYDLAYSFSNQTRFLGFELHKMEQFWSPRPIRYRCYWLSGVVVAFQPEDILSYPNSVLNLSERIHWLISAIHDPMAVIAAASSKSFPCLNVINIQLRVICITVGIRKMWFHDLKKFARIERKQ